MTLEEKIKELGLLPVTEEEKAKIDKHCLQEVGALLPDGEVSRWDFVLWHQGKPYFYSRRFIQDHDVAEIKAFLDSTSKHQK